MKKSGIETDEMIGDWLNSIEAAQNTRRNYILSMVEYTNYTGMTPEGLIEQAESEIMAGTLMRKRSIKKHLLGFREMLKKRGLAPRSVHNHITAAKSFYRANDIDLPVLNSKKHFKAKTLKENDLRLVKEDIEAILKHANVRNRALILVMVSSGLAQSDVLDTKVGAFKHGYDPDTGITTLHVRRIKTDYDFYTFLSPEASQAVIDWMELRERKPKGEAGTRRYAKHRIQSDNDYMFTKNDIPATYLETFNDEERRLKSQGLMDALRQLAKRTGKETNMKQWSLIRAHNFRKFFNTTLLNNGADIFFVDYLMGHTIDGTHAAYFRADPEKLRERYIKYLPFLSIEDTEIKTVESAEYGELKNNYNAMCDRVKELERKDTERGELLDLIATNPEILNALKGRTKEKTTP